MRRGRLLRYLRTGPPTIGAVALAPLRAVYAYLALTTPLVHGDRRRIRVAPSAHLSNALFNVVSGSITVGENVVMAHNVCLLTGTHDPDLTGPERVLSVADRGRDIVVEEGAWIASNATVLGGCRIGRYAVVAAGSVVTHDVPAFTVVAGVPARPLRSLREH